MIVEGNLIALTLCAAVTMLPLLLVVAYPRSLTDKDGGNMMDAEENSGAVAGRFVTVSAKVYKDAFKAPIKLGQCPLAMEEGSIKTCKDEFEGEVVHLPKASTLVDVSRVESSEDILLHVMGGVGFSIGVLGLASINPKVKVAVTTETGKDSLNLMSSYEINKGVMTLRNPRVKHLGGGGQRTLFLSEIELGGNELLLVTLGFESEKQKREVEVSVSLKILFFSITAKLNYMHEELKSTASCRIQFKSSWRKDLDEFFSHLENCIPRAQEIENMYMQGPKELRDMSLEDERSHYFYYFSSWKASPYGTQFNLALINHDLEFLTEQNTEIKAVIHRINKLKDQSWPAEVKKEMVQLNTTLSDMTQRLTDGLDRYHALSQDERQQLRDIYGSSRAPHYYSRHLNRIIS